MNSSNYWGQSSADELPPAGPPVAPAPPAPPADAGLYYGAPTDYQNTPPAPAPQPPQFSWNAPGYENAAPRGGFQGSPPVTDLGDIDAPGPGEAIPPYLGEMEPRQPISQTFGDGPTYGPPVAAGGYASSEYAKSHAKPTGHGAGGPAGPSALSKAHGALRGTYDDDKGALQRGATAEQDRSAMMNEGAELMARQKQDDQMIQRLEAAEAAKTFGDYSAETQRQVDDVRQQKINPNRAYADTGSAVAAVLGGLMGGIYQGINKLEKNPFIEQMNKVIDRAIAAQEHDLRTKKEGIGERKGLLAEMRATYKDENVAKLQARNLYYEGAKEELMAQAGKYDSPAIQARTDQAITALTRAQTQLDINKALQDLANARAAAAAAKAQQEADFKHRLEMDTHSQGWAKLGIESANGKATGGKSQQDAVTHVGDKLMDLDKQGYGPDIEMLHKYIVDPKTQQVDPSRSIPGVGRMADFREAVAPPMGKGPAGDLVPNPGYLAVRGIQSSVVGLDPQERQNKNAMDRVFLGFKNVKTGSAASKEEAQAIANSYFGAKTPEEVASAVDMSYQFLQRQRDAIRAENPGATAEYESNMRNLKAEDRAGTVKRERP